LGILGKKYFPLGRIVARTNRNFFIGEISKRNGNYELFMGWLKVVGDGILDFTHISGRSDFEKEWNETDSDLLTKTTEQLTKVRNLKFSSL
jgi:hypothetical protein